MSTPAYRCTQYTPESGPGAIRCSEPATHKLYAYNGKPVPGGNYCHLHGQAIHDEYLEKLGQNWEIVRLPA